MPEDRMRRWCDKDLLRACGVPDRYLIASWDEVNPPLLEPLHEWVGNLDQHVRDGYGMTFYGPYGVGKTFAAVLALDAVAGAEGRVTYRMGVGEDAKELYEPYECYFVLASVMSEVLHRPSEKGNRERIAGWKQSDLLVVDDWHKMYLGAEWDRTQLEAVFDVRHAELRPTILTINDADVFKALPGVRDRLRECSQFVVLDEDTASRRGRS